MLNSELYCNYSCCYFDEHILGPEIQARFEAMLKDPTQRAKLQKAMPALEQDELPADEDERKICAQLHESVIKTENAAYIKAMNEETAIRFCRG